MKVTSLVKRTSLDNAPAITKLDEVVDSKARKVFLFDASGSMGCQIASGYTSQYDWTPEVMEKIKGTLWEYRKEWELVKADPMTTLFADPTVLAAAELCFAEDGSIKSDEELQTIIVQQSWLGLFGVGINWAEHSEKPPSRMDVVRKLALEEILKRLNKYPDGPISVLKFNDQQEVLFADVSEIKTTLEDALRKLIPWGGTNILAAIKAALKLCRENPSEVGVYHLIIVSDGEDYAANEGIGEWVPILKQSGVVMDYIHIGDVCVNQGLKRACEALGGELVSVNSEKDFQDKFIEKVNRKLLGA